MGEDVEGQEGGESSDELDALRKEILERHPEEGPPEPDDAQHIEGEQAEASGSELDQLRDEIARRRPPEESA
jgi:hypothetical protein